MKLFVPAAFVAALAVAPAQVIRAQEAPLVPRPQVRIDFPIIDAPYNFAQGLRAPSMGQTGAITETFYELAHPAIERAWGSHRTLSNVSLILFDTFGGLLPGGDGWMHEEYHRAVLGHRGVGSFDEIYLLNIGASAVSVSHVKDEDLIRFKAEHPVDFVRAAAAGIEGENKLIEGLERNRFFHASRANNVALYWLTKANSVFYVWSGATADADSMTDELNRLDGASIAARDWVGHDFTAWVHDLHRPGEPYAARGVHPSGVGINRYVKNSDLTPEEHDFLAREGKLQLINFIDPNLLGVSGMTVRNPLNDAEMRVNASASHYLTSFGHAVDVNVFMKQDMTNLFVVLHRFTNGARSFLGAEAQLLDVPVRVGGMTLDVSPRVALWRQPEAQAFRTAMGQTGGLASLLVRQATAARLASFAELEGKTAGWVAGNVHLERNVSVRVGGSVRID